MDFQTNAAHLEATTSDGNALARVLSALKPKRREATPSRQRGSAAEQSPPGEVDVLVPRGWAFA